MISTVIYHPKLIKLMSHLRARSSGSSGVFLVHRADLLRQMFLHHLVQALHVFRCFESFFV